MKKDFGMDKNFSDMDGYIGWQGYGGSQLYWHPEHQIGFAYAMTLLDSDFSSIIGKSMQAKTLEIARKLK